MTLTTFFLAGTMQGSRRGDAQIDQSYRDDIADIIRRSVPNALIKCPGDIMRETLQPFENEIRQSHHAMLQQSVVDAQAYPDALCKLTDMFHALVDLAAESDVCVAYLPNHEASMGTAAEMFAAFRAGKRVIAITEMKQNLCVLACAHHIVPDFDAFAALLEQLIEDMDFTPKAGGMGL